MTPGGYLVDAQRLINVPDPEMDMNRVAGRTPLVRMWRLITALKRLTPGAYAMAPPRRSVDRELEEFSSPWE